MPLIFLAKITGFVIEQEDEKMFKKKYMDLTAGEMMLWAVAGSALILGVEWLTLFDGATKIKDACSTAASKAKDTAEDLKEKVETKFKKS